MQDTALLFKEKLLKTLDETQRVADVKTALQVIKRLESFKISKQALEDSRLGRIVNDLRKQTSDKELAKRAKNLVRQWQELVTSPSTSNNWSPSVPPQVASSSSCLPSPVTNQPKGLYNDVSNKNNNQVNGKIAPSSTKSNNNGHMRSSAVFTENKIRSAETSPVLNTGSSVLKRSVTIPHSLENTYTQNGFHLHGPSKLVQHSVSGKVSEGQESKDLDRNVKNSSNLHSNSYTKLNHRHDDSRNVDLTSRPSDSYKDRVELDKHSKSVSAVKPAAETVISGDVGQSQTLNGLKLKIKRTRAKDSDNSVVETYISAIPEEKRFSLESSSVVNSRAASPVGSFVDKKRQPSSSTDSLSTVNQTVTSRQSKSVLDNSASNRSCQSIPVYTESSSNVAARTISPSAALGKPMTASSALGKPATPLATIGKSSTPQTAFRPSTPLAGLGKPTTPAAALGRPTTPSAALGRPTTPAALGKPTTPLATVARPSTPLATSSKVVSAALTSNPRLERSTSKVATTSELIQKLYSSGNLRIVASETLERIASNKIKKESDNDSSPPEIKAKSRKGARDISDAKPPGRLKRPRLEGEDSSEAWDKSNRSEDTGLISLISRLEREPTDDEIMAATRAQPVRSTLNRSNDQLTQNSSILSDSVNEFDLLPPLDVDSIDWNSLEYEALSPSQRAPVTSDDVERLHNEQWTHVNGQYDYRRDWRSWSETYTMTSYNGSLLHILPYVNIDD